ncbi:MAG: nicotinate-nucleotide adenylyltransferase [Chromatiaceae bacterium]|nr:MAG: nicotinate-nucleotide adenylyltransferase [Chromatiaceae bacterium]
MIGLFGGTFDPIHFGHLRAALDCVQGLDLAELRLLPLHIAPHRAQPIASGALRVAMIEAALNGVGSGLGSCDGAESPPPAGRIVIDPRELNRAGPSYTVETLEELRREIGTETPLGLLIGTDTFNGFMDWRRPRDILDLAHLVVMQRPGAPTVRDAVLRQEIQHRRIDDPAVLHRVAGGHICFQTVTQLDISATGIRRIIAIGQSPRYLLPDPVITLLARDGCYGRVIGVTPGARVGLPHPT